MVRAQVAAISSQIERLAFEHDRHRQAGSDVIAEMQRRSANHAESSAIPKTAASSKPCAGSTERQDEPQAAPQEAATQILEAPEAVGPGEVEEAMWSPRLHALRQRWTSIFGTTGEVAEDKPQDAAVELSRNVPNCVDDIEPTLVTGDAMLVPEIDVTEPAKPQLPAKETIQEETIQEESEHVFFRNLFDDPHFAMLVGSFTGVLAVFNYGITAQSCGEVMRATLQTLYATTTTPLVYICGGLSMFRGVLDTVCRLNLSHGSWEDVPRMLTARRLCAMTALGNRLYVFGGEFEVYELWPSDEVSHRYRQVGAAECYNHFRSVWEPLTPMPTARAGCAAVQLGGMIYVCGGRRGEVVLAKVERFDPRTERWERLPDMPTARSGCCAVALRGMVYVLGGKDLDGRITGAVDGFDPFTGWWHALDPMATPRSAFAAGVVGSHLYVAGGFDGTNGVASAECFDPSCGTWLQLEPMVTWHIGAAAVVVSERFFVLGGKVASNFEDSCECYDPSTGKWTLAPKLLERRVYCSGTAIVSCL